MFSASGHAVTTKIIYPPRRANNDSVPRVAPIGKQLRSIRGMLSRRYRYMRQSSAQGGRELVSDESACSVSPVSRPIVGYHPGDVSNASCRIQDESGSNQVGMSRLRSVPSTSFSLGRPTSRLGRLARLHDSRDKSTRLEATGF